MTAAEFEILRLKLQIAELQTAIHQIGSANALRMIQTVQLFARCVEHINDKQLLHDIGKFLDTQPL
jgi:hypothetical protein